MQKAHDNCVTCGGSYGSVALHNGKKAKRSARLQSAYAGDASGVRAVALVAANYYAAKTGSSVSSAEKKAVDSLTKGSVSYEGNTGTLKDIALTIYPAEARIEFVASEILKRLGAGLDVMRHGVAYVRQRASGATSLSPSAWIKAKKKARKVTKSAAGASQGVYVEDILASVEAQEARAAELAGNPARLAALSPQDKGIFRFIMARRAARMQAAAAGPRFYVLNQELTKLGGPRVRGRFSARQARLSGPMQQKIAALEAEIEQMKLAQETAAAEARAQADAALAAAEAAVAAASPSIVVQVPYPAPVQPVGVPVDQNISVQGGAVDAAAMAGLYGLTGDNVYGTQALRRVQLREKLKQARRRRALEGGYGALHNPAKPEKIGAIKRFTNIFSAEGREENKRQRKAMQAWRNSQKG